jgi:hypothetical protein
MAASIEELSYELTAGALAEQERALNALRTRAGTIVAAGVHLGIVPRRKGQQWHLRRMGDPCADRIRHVPRVRDLGAASSLARICLPRRGVARDERSGGRRGRRAGISSGRIWIEPSLDTNRDKIGELSSWFTASCILLAAEVILWTISVAG